MKRREVLIMGVLLVGGFISMFLDGFKPKVHVMQPKELLYEVNKSGHFISTDEVAKMIMESDPSLLLIDVRSPEEFKKFSLEGAINIPADKLMDKDNRAYFDENDYTTVLYSNGTSIAEQSWLMLRSYDFKGNKVMRGGLNEWYKTIINPQKPADDELTAELEKKYLFRKGAQVYFTGANPVGSASSSKPKAPSKPVVKRKKKEVSGGCG